MPKRANLDAQWQDRERPGSPRFASVRVGSTWFDRKINMFADVRMAGKRSGARGVCTGGVGQGSSQSVAVSRSDILHYHHPVGYAAAWAGNCGNIREKRLFPVSVIFHAGLCGPGANPCAAKGSQPKQGKLAKAISRIYLFLWDAPARMKAFQAWSMRSSAGYGHSNWSNQYTQRAAAAAFNPIFPGALK